jgi:hypothetical protein
MKTILSTALLLTLAPVTAGAQINAGEQSPEPNVPFAMTQVATFNLPWGQGGMLGLYVSPHFAKDQSVYLT